MKKVLVVAMAMVFTASVASVSMAASVKCTVIAVDGNKVTMDCGKKASKFSVGNKCKVKDEKKKAIEGC